MKPLLRQLFAAAVFSATATVSAAGVTLPPAAQACLTPATWSMPDGGQFRSASASVVLTASAKRDVVLLGEAHGDDDHHRWQLQALAALYTLRPDMVVGFEMFPRRLQPVLERWVAGELTLRQFVEQSEWDTVWSLPFELYLPLFQFARINRIPMLALNVDRKLNKAITAKGWDAVPPAEREGVSRAAPPSAAYRQYLFDVYRQHTAMHGHDDNKANQDDTAFRFFVESQTTWDRAMAEALARRLLPAGAGGKPLVVGIIGSGHLRYGYGVQHQLRDLGLNDVGTLLPMDADVDCKELRSGLADAVFALPPQASAKPEPPRLGVQLEQNEGGVQIAAITAGSLAERSGLKSGDRLLELGGVEVKKVSPVIAAIRQQAAGSWLPLRLQRGDATLELVLKFPPKP
ncbi:MAG: ChaN family lipoprotein [Oxalobacteraceae bacterium]|nr:ChaN family lipoprotein [Oxalobacteraceae bacterium]